MCCSMHAAAAWETVAAPPVGRKVCVCEFVCVGVCAREREKRMHAHTHKEAQCTDCRFRPTREERRVRHTSKICAGEARRCCWLGMSGRGIGTGGGPEGDTTAGMAGCDAAFCSPTPSPLCVGVSCARELRG